MSGTVRRRTNKETGEYQDDFYYRCKHRKKINETDFCNYKPSLNQNELNREVEQMVTAIVNNTECGEFIIRQLDTRVDVSVLEKEREQLRSQLRQLSGAKNKLINMLDKLDVTDKHYDRKYQDMQDRLDNLYDKIGDIDELLKEINEKINRAYGKQITSKQVYQILQFFDKMYYELTDLEKKEFFQDFIESIELYPERMEDGRIVKQINFEFPVFYKGVESMAIRLPNEKTVETVVLLSREKVDGYVEIDLDIEKLEGKSGMATYAEIKAYVEKKHRLKVSSLYIGQIKDKVGIKERKNYNVSSGEGRVPICPTEKEEAIMDAFRHFNLI